MVAVVRPFALQWFLFVVWIEVERRRAADVAGDAAMEVHILPFGVALVPDARLLRLVRVRMVLAVNVLGEAHVGDARRLLAQQMDVRIQNGRVDGLAIFAQNIFEIEFVEIHSLD